MEDIIKRKKNLTTEDTEDTEGKEKMKTHSSSSSFLLPPRNSVSSVVFILPN